MKIDVRPVREDELPAWFDVLSTAFLSRPDTTAIAEELKPLWDLSRAWTALEGETIVGTLRSWATEITVPGGAQLPGSAIAAVTVRATHRRRGILRRMMTAEHAGARERGEAVTLLYAAEYPIYGRFGYGPACQIATWELATKNARFQRAATGAVEFVRPSPEVRDEMVRVHEAWRVGQPGEIRRRIYNWDYDLGLRPSAWGDDWKGFVAFHRDEAGTVDGYVRYHAEEKFERFQPVGTATIDDFQALTDDAYDALWQLLAANDMLATVKTTHGRRAERLPWLLENARAAQLTELHDGLWVKLIDIPRALAARTYEQTGSLVIEAVEDAGTEREARTRVALDVGPEGATCEPTTRSPDLTIHGGALGAAYLGGTRLSDAALRTGVDEGRAGALADADALFRTADPPWCSTFF